MGVFEDRLLKAESFGPEDLIRFAKTRYDECGDESPRLSRSAPSSSVDLVEGVLCVNRIGFTATEEVEELVAALDQASQQAHQRGAFLDSYTFSVMGDVARLADAPVHSERDWGSPLRVLRGEEIVGRFDEYLAALRVHDAQVSIPSERGSVQAPVAPSEIVFGFLFTQSTYPENYERVREFFSLVDPTKPDSRWAFFTHARMIVNTIRALALSLPVRLSERRDAEDEQFVGDLVETAWSWLTARREAEVHRGGVDKRVPVDPRWRSLVDTLREQVASLDSHFSFAAALLAIDSHPDAASVEGVGQSRR